MSDILTNASRYTSGNSTRIDGAGKNAGNTRSDDGSKIKFDCSGLVYHVLRESGYNVPYSNSSAMSNAQTFNGGWATTVAANGSVPPGTLVYFGGHVGIVQTYNPITGRGTFLSMTGNDNVGNVKADEPFSTNTEDRKFYWGGQNGFKGFAAVKPELYDPNLDQHANGANPDRPVFNIPEHKSVGFITLPDNGGFPKSSAARDLSSEPAVAAASFAATTNPVTNLFDVSSTSPFAETLAHLESRGQPFDGYRAVNDDGEGIGAVGRYGFRASSLKAIGWMDAHGDWTSAAKAQGVNGVESFLDNPQAQETARVSYMQTLKNELKANGAWSMIGDTVEGHTITDAGLIAAAWKEGAGKVARVFKGESTNADVEKNVFFRLDEFGALPPGAGDSNAAGSNSITAPTGHWENADDAYFDPTTGVQVSGGQRVWVPDTPTAGAGRGNVNPPSAASGAEQTTAPSRNPSVIQISADGSTATLPNGQTVHAGPGGKLDIDADGILMVSRPAQGWTNADGSAADIRQITAYEPSGAQIGTSIAQNLPGEAAPVENYSLRTVNVPQPDGSTSEVETHFQAGVGWVDDAGNTVLSLKDAQTQYEAKIANLIQGAGADNDYIPGGPTGEEQGLPQAGNPTDTEPHVQSDPNSDFQNALLAAFSKSSPAIKVGPAIQLAGLDTGTVSDAGNGFAEPQATANTTGSPTQKTAETWDYTQANNPAYILNLSNVLSQKPESKKNEINDVFMVEFSGFFIGNHRPVICQCRKRYRNRASLYGW